ncbi:MAG: biotin/lipoyl-binding protein, partial [Myxococcales bacterium]|nr:biotin/lipoyl-binding protein [Myxococcales bacterium]
MTKTNRAAWALLALVVALAAGCNEATKVTLPAAAKSDGQASVAAADPIEVSVTTATEARVDAPIRVSGHLEPLRAVTLGSDVTGRIVEIPVKEGDHVEKGDLLVRFDARQVRAQQAQSEAAAAAARAQGAQLSADYARMAPLAAKGAVAQADVDR